MPIFELKGKLSSTPKLFYREKNLEVWSYELLDLTQLLGVFLRVYEILNVIS